NYFWPNGSVDGLGNARVIRWAGSDPSGPSDSSYTYAMVDLNPSSFVAPTVSIYSSAAHAGTVLRELIHSKPAGQQDYVISKTYMTTTSAQTLKELWHYTLSAAGHYSDFSVSPSNKTAGVTHSAASTQMLSKFVAAGSDRSIALVTDNSNGSWSPSHGQT